MSDGPNQQNAAQPSDNPNALVLIDDLRVFRYHDATTTLRTSRAAVTYLREHATEPFGQLWLDHDLGDAIGTNDTISPVVDWLCARAHDNAPLRVDLILIHTTNVAGGNWMTTALNRAGYPTRRIAAAEHMRIDEALRAHATTSEATTIPGDGENT